MCNDASSSDCSNIDSDSFCGDCSQFSKTGQCEFVTKSKSQVDCMQRVKCQVSEMPSSSLYLPQSDCTENHGTCSQPMYTLGVTKSQCESSEKCGISAVNSVVCVIPDLPSEACTCSLTQVVNYPYKLCTCEFSDLTLCDRYGGVLVNTSDYSSCMQLQVCKQTLQGSGVKFITLAQGSACTDCNNKGELIPMLTFERGLWKPNSFTPLKWMKREKVYTRKWLDKSVDFDKWFNFITAVFSQVLMPIKTNYVAPIENTKIWFDLLNCSCVLKHGNCFSDEIKFPMSVISHVSGHSALFSSPFFTYLYSSVKQNPIQLKFIYVYKHISTVFPISTSVAIIDQKVQYNGIVISNGVSINSEIDEMITLCVPIDGTQVMVHSDDPSDYTRLKMATISRNEMKFENDLKLFREKSLACTQVKANDKRVLFAVVLNGKQGPVPPAPIESKKSMGVTFKQVSHFFLFFIVFLLI